MIEPTQTPKRARARSSGQVVPFPSGAKAAGPDPSMLTFSWEMLERQLADLAVTSKQRALAGSLISGTRKQARFKPSEQVLREVLCIASVLMDESFHPDLNPSDEGEGEMT